MKKNMTYLVALFLLASSMSVSAQNTRIALVNLIDTSYYYYHIAVTIFGNYEETIKLNFSQKSYIENEVKKYMSPYFEVSVISIPLDLVVSEGIRDKFAGLLKKSVKEWIAGLTKDYDLVVFMFTGEVDDRITQAPVKLKSSGLYTRSNSFGTDLSVVYSTLYFEAYMTPTVKLLEYRTGLSTFFNKIKYTPLPKETKTYNSQEIDNISSELKILIDKRIEYFLTTSYLVPKDKYSVVKEGLPIGK
jgi:hypothetical protein